MTSARRGGYRGANPEELPSFLDRIQLPGVPIIRRYSVGRNQSSACGMLAATRAQPPEAIQE